MIYLKSYEDLYGVLTIQDNQIILDNISVGNIKCDFKDTSIKEKAVSLVNKEVKVTGLAYCNWETGLYDLIEVDNVEEFTDLGIVEFVNVLASVIGKDYEDIDDAIEYVRHIRSDE